MTDPVTFSGSTSVFYCYEQGRVIKRPRSFDHPLFSEDVHRAFEVEPAILERLGDHPRIVKYHGRSGNGLVLDQATHGNLEDFLFENHPLGMTLRLKWMRQAIESVAYIHENGVFHQDLRPEQFLIHETMPGSLDLWLSDFGGSLCPALNLDGGHLPDSGFFDPNLGSKFPQAQDIFSLGSVCFVIFTGAWPFREPGPFKPGQVKQQYEEQVDECFRKNIFPDVSNLIVGDIISGCWRKKFKDAQEILDEFQSCVRFPEGHSSIDMCV